jgi:hypothetical protein
MTSEYLEQQLEKWKRFLLLFLGAGLTLAASTFGTTSEYTFSGGWILAWIVLQLGTVPAGLLMLFSKDWRQLPLTQRLNVAFGFLGIGWLGWLAIGFHICAREPYTFAFILLPGAVLATIYLLQRRAHAIPPEEIFP